MYLTTFIRASAAFGRLAPAPAVPHDAMAACARDAGCDIGDLCVNARRAHYKSVQHFIGRVGERSPRYVLKVDAAGEGHRWDPQREFDGLTFVHGLFGRDASFGAIEPVAFGQSPRFILTRFAEGRSLRPDFDAAVRRGRPDAMARAAGAAALAARWLARIRGSAPHPGEGVEPDAYVRFCGERVAEIEAGASRHGRRLHPLLSHITRWAHGLDGECLGAMSQSHPAHGDLAPQNFHLASDGRFIVLDLEGFGWRPLDIDLANFRMRLEHYAIRGGASRCRAEALWRPFLDARDAAGGSPALDLLSYLHKALAHVAWVCGRVDAGRKRSTRPLSNRIRSSIWVRDRLRWLADLPEDTSAACRYFRTRL
jgi:hypothetical protein